MKSPHSSPAGHAVSQPSLTRAWFGLLAVAAVCFVAAPLRAAVSSVTGSYESEGRIVETDSDYTGAVSLRALLGLEFDLARGLRLHADVTQVDLEQHDRTFTIRTKNAKGDTEWSAKWERNGGFEPLKEGVKLVIRGRSGGTDLCMFTFSPLNEGAALLVEVQRLKDSVSGPIGQPVGKFLFLRAAPAS